MNELDRAEREFWKVYYRSPAQKAIVWCKEQELPLLLQWIEYFTEWSVIIKLSQKSTIRFKNDIPQGCLSQLKSFDNFKMWLGNPPAFYNNEANDSGETAGVLFEIHDTNLYDSISLPDELLDNLLANALVNLIPNHLYLNGLHSSSNGQRIYLEYSCEPSHPPEGIHSLIAVTACLQGYGDAILFYPLIKSFLERKKKEKYHIHIYVSSYQATSMLNFLLRDFDHIISVPHIKCFDAVLKSGQYDQCYHVPFPRYAFDKIHVVDYWAEALGVTASTLPYDVSGIHFPVLPNSIKSAIDQARAKNKKIVGLQHYSASWSGRKSWSPEQVYSFINKCRNSDIQLINLSPHAYDQLEGVIDVSHLSVIDLFSVIRSVDAVVGIDSCAGHMASLCGIPNLTIWVGNYPHAMQDVNGRIAGRVSFRPTFYNYSIASVGGKPNDIPSTLVLNRLRGILDGIINLSTVRLTMEDTLKNKEIEYTHNLISGGDEP